MASNASCLWSFWLIAILSLLWNLIGVIDFVMTLTRNADYLASFTPEQIAYFTSFPPWFIFVWGCGVWGALLGSILLLLRHRWAVSAFALSLAGLAVSSLWQYGLSGADLSAIMPPGAWVFTIVIWIIAIALFYYSIRQRRRGVLR